MPDQVTYVCVSCHQIIGRCCVCLGRAELHEHVSGEWYCKPCWEVSALAHEAANSQAVDAFHAVSA